MKNPYDKYGRREFVRDFGVAAGLAIPFLRSAVAMGQTATAPVRLLIVPLHHGWGYDGTDDLFRTSGTSFTIPAPLDAFESIRQQTVFIEGLRSTNWGNAHDVNYTDMLTCGVRYNEPTSPALSGVFRYPRSPSIDWMIGDHFGKNVLRLSANYRSFGAVHHPMSFDKSLRSLPFFTSARDAYMNVIDPLKQLQVNQAGGSKTKGTQSLLNYLGKDSERMLAQLQGKQREKMEGYLGALKALGDRILLSSNSGTDLASIILPNSPGVTAGFNEMIDSYLEMIRIAFLLDTHRVAVLGIGDGDTYNQWNWTDSKNVSHTGNIYAPGEDFHHGIAHYDKGPNYSIDRDRRLAMNAWVKWQAAKIVGLVNRLSNTIDVDGRRLIENTVIVLLGEVGNGTHNTSNMVYTVIGGGGGVIKRNRWISTPKFNSGNRGGFYWGTRDVNNQLYEYSINYINGISQNHAADLWVSIARLCGLPINSFGIDVYNRAPIQLV